MPLLVRLVKAVRIVRIFRAVLGDVKELQKIEIACGLSPWTLEGYISEVAQRDTAAFIARADDGEAVGFLIGRVPTAPEGAAEIFNIGILPEMRRRGLGNALLAEFLEVCRNCRASEVWLEARASNHEAVSFYRVNGFETNGTRPNFYQNPSEDAQLMTLKLVHESPLTKS